MRWVFRGDEVSKPLKVRSPCTGYCTTSSLADPVCIGCYRDAKDVDMWNRYSEHEKVLAMMRAHQNYKVMTEKKA